LPEYALVRSSLGIEQQNPGAARPAVEPCQIVTLNIYEMGLEERPLKAATRRRTPKTGVLARS
jgi:hypothetical protein